MMINVYTQIWLELCEEEVKGGVIHGSQPEYQQFTNCLLEWVASKVDLAVCHCTLCSRSVRIIRYV